MKIAINNSYGGFSLSPLAVKRLAELQGKECYFFKTVFKQKERLSYYEEITIEDCYKLSWTAFTINNPHEVWDAKDWNESSEEKKDELNKIYKSISLNSNPEDRANKLLIQTIEELGEKANGNYAKLKIVEIPDDVKYQIEEYDGLEHISEIHRTWC